MTEKTLIKYLDFLKSECLRHQNDKKITDDEVNQLEIEIKKFKERLIESSISEDIKEEVLNIDFDLDYENHNRSKLRWLKIFGDSYGKEHYKQLNSKNRFEKLSNDIDNTLFKIKSII